MRTRIKVCGITRIEDALAAAAAGIDAIGLVFYPASKRAVTVEQAAAICHALPAFVARVAVMVDPQADYVRSICAGAGINVLQFHGSESGDFCRSFALPYIKAVGMRPDTDLARIEADFPDAAALLADTWDPVSHGGTGRAFDWSRLPARLARPLVLAGGLTPVNVAAAVASVRPFAVDVSGGVELAPGVKNPDLIRAFAQQVNSIDSTR